jgi:hypothetical protein
MPDTSDFSRSDAALVALRPTIATTNPAEAEVTAGHFLHITLRPVLKLQNELLLLLVADFVRDHHLRLAPDLAEQQRQLAELLTRNTKLRYTIVGLITGQFTAAEYAFYRPHRAELNRRLLELAQRRVLNQMAIVVQLTAAGEA